MNGLSLWWQNAYLQKNTMVGTLMSNHTRIHAKVKDMNNHEDLSTTIYWSDENDIVLSSYVVKTRSGEKYFYKQPLLGITKDDGKKPCKIQTSLIQEKKDW